MATHEDLRAVAGKALADPEFRKKLIDNPEAAVKEAGIELSEEQMQALKEMDKEQFEKGLAEIDERLTMGCWSRSIGEVIYDVICGWD
jgi:hypothetical protein